MVLRDKIFGDEFKIWWSTTCSKPGICSAILWPIWFVHVWLLPRVVLSKWEVWLSPFLIIALLLSYFAYFLIIPLSWMDRFHGLLGAWERWLSPPRSHQGGDFPTARGDRLTTLRFALVFFLHHKHLACNTRSQCPGIARFRCVLFVADIPNFGYVQPSPRIPLTSWLLSLGWEPAAQTRCRVRQKIFAPLETNNLQI